MSSETIVKVIKYCLAVFFGGSIGGLIGFRIGFRKAITQSQNGGDNAKMTQIGEVHYG